MTLLFDGADWDFKTLQHALDAIQDIAFNDLGLDIYQNQIEIISSEQMLDAYSSHGMPLNYRHWSFGKHFAREEMLYRTGMAGLAYEIVINSDPCISYLMEDNTMTMQALVIAHAAFGHNHFFKNNYLFRQWTDAEGILDYLDFSKKYITKCEEEYGLEEVEIILDSAHAIMNQGVFRYHRPPRRTELEEEEKLRKRIAHERATFNDLWRTVPQMKVSEPAEGAYGDAGQSSMNLPEENLLYFIEKYSPVLSPWQAEILRIVRNIAQYFYPQRQTKVMNEGCATFVHHYIMHKLHERGQISDGSLLEFLHSHTSVVFQPDFDDPRYSGTNPYALGFAMMEDIKRICEKPDEEDYDWFPELAGSGDWRSALKHAWANFRDESFIQQYLSPKVVRDFKLFSLHDESESPVYEVSAIHDELGYRKVRSILAQSHDIGSIDPNIQVVSADLSGDRKLILQHNRHRGVPLDEIQSGKVLGHVQRLWGHDVEMIDVDDRAPQD